MKALDLTGQQFERLKVIAKAEDYISPKGRACDMWLCVCTCGNSKAVRGSSLLSGLTKSCGCLQKEITKKNRETHGMRNTKLYGEWHGIKTRCMNKNAERFKDYGGRGITVCDEWKNDFQAFYDYVSKLPHFGEAGYSLDRINNDGNYEPNNVRWATRIEQANNTRRTNRKRG